MDLGSLEVVQWLLKNTQNSVAAKDQAGITPVHVAAK